MADLFKLTGNEQLDANFTELPKRVQKTVLRQGVRTAAKIVQAQAVANVPSKSGTLAASLKVRAGKRSRTTPNQVSVQVITEEGWFKGKAFYAAFGELGFKLGARKATPFVTKDGTVARYKLGTRWLKARIPVTGKHWIKRALDSKGPEAAAAAVEIIAAGIEREAASLGK